MMPFCALAREQKPREETSTQMASRFSERIRICVQYPFATSPGIFRRNAARESPGGWANTEPPSCVAFETSRMQFEFHEPCLRARSPQSDRKSTRLNSSHLGISY